MNKKITGIYKITSPTGKIYIGKSIDINKRFIGYKNLHCEFQTKLYHSFVKHGIENHKFEIICECDVSKLSELEIYYIGMYKSFNSKNGLNLRAGGEGGVVSDETRKKMSEWQFNKNVSIETRDRISKSLIGRKQPQEQIDKRIESQTGENNYWYGKEIPHLIESNKRRKGEKRSEETKRKQSEVKMKDKNSFFGKTHTKETLEKIKKTKDGKSQDEKDATRKKQSETRLNKTKEEKDSIYKKRLETINKKSQEEKNAIIEKMRLTKKNKSQEEKDLIIAKQMETKNKKTQVEKDEETRRRVESFKRTRQEKLTMIF